MPSIDINISSCRPLLSLARSLCVAANNLDLVRLDRDAAIVHLERHVLDEEGPNFVAEAVCVQAPLFSSHSSAPNSIHLQAPGQRPHYLELQSALDVLLQRLGDCLVEVAQDLHGQLRMDALVADQIVQRVSQGEPDTATRVSNGVCSGPAASGPLPAPTVELVE